MPWPAGVLNRARDALTEDTDCFVSYPLCSEIPTPRFCAMEVVRSKGRTLTDVTSLSSHHYSPSDAAFKCEEEIDIEPPSPPDPVVTSSEEGEVEGFMLEVEMSEIRYLGPPRNKADELSHRLLCDGFAGTGQLSILASFLPDKVSRHHRFTGRDALALNFGTGAFVRGPMCGVRRHVYDYPWTTALLVVLLKTEFPGYCFSSCSYLVNVSTTLHRDPRNDEACPNLVVACSSWSGGGELWLEDSAGTVLETGHKGILILLQPKGLLNGHTPHQTMPWKGYRSILVGFHIRDSWKLEESDASALTSIGFPLRERP